MAEDGTLEARAQHDGYRSPALARLQDPIRQTAPIRDIAEAGRPEADSALDHQALAALESRLEQLEQQQLAVVANLHEAHAAFMHLAERVSALARRVEAPDGDGRATAPP